MLLLMNTYSKPVTTEDYQKMAQIARDFISTSNLLLTSDYYKEVR